MALARVFEFGTSWNEKLFLYTLLRRGEDIEDQARAVTLFRALEDEVTVKHKLHHKHIIQRFGRLLHRNMALGSDSSSEKIAFFKEPHSSF